MSVHGAEDAAEAKALGTASGAFPDLAVDIADLVVVFAYRDETEVGLAVVKVGQINLRFVVGNPLTPSLGRL